MPVAIAFPSPAGTGVTPNAVKLTATGSGGGGTGVMSRATLVASMKPGPLKTYLNSLSSAQWVALGTDAKVSVIVHLVDTGAAAAAVAVDFVSVTNLQIQVSGNFIAIVEIAFKHSIER